MEVVRGSIILFRCLQPFRIRIGYPCMEERERERDRERERLDSKARTSITKPSALPLCLMRSYLRNRSAGMLIIFYIFTFLHKIIKIFSVYIYKTRLGNVRHKS